MDEYTRKIEKVEAIQFTIENLPKLFDMFDTLTAIKYPLRGIYLREVYNGSSKSGTGFVELGEYIYKDKVGNLHCMPADEFERLYKK